MSSSCITPLTKKVQQTAAALLMRDFLYDLLDEKRRPAQLYD